MNHRVTMSMLRSMVCAAALTATPLAAAAQAPDAAQAAPSAVPTPVRPAAELKAEALLNNAMKVAMTQGIAALRNDIPAMTEALDAAPAEYPQIDTRGEVTIVHGGGLGAMMRAALMGKSAVQTANVYPDLALAVGSYYVETKQMQAAITALDKGLKLQPGEPGLVGEKGVALAALGRFGEAVAMYDAALATGQGDPMLLARLHRGRGVVLIDLKRLDEAEAALKTSLELQPNHPLALNELKYIAQIRGGTPINKPIGVVTAAEAATEPLK